MPPLFVIAFKIMRSDDAPDFWRMHPRLYATEAEARADLRKQELDLEGSLPTDCTVDEARVFKLTEPS